LDTNNAHLAEKGFLMREGSVVDVTLIAARPSMNIKECKHDPEMHRTKKDNNWHVCMEAHFGV